MKTTCNSLPCEIFMWIKPNIWQISNEQFVCSLTTYQSPIVNLLEWEGELRVSSMIPHFLSSEQLPPYFSKTILRQDDKVVNKSSSAVVSCFRGCYQIVTERWENNVFDLLLFWIYFKVAEHGQWYYCTSRVAWEVNQFTLSLVEFSNSQVFGVR